MNFKNLMAFALVGALSAGIAAPVLAMGADSIAKRQELMKSNGATLKAAGSATGADAIAAGETLVANFTALNDLWDKDSMSGDTKALPAIWNADGSVSDAFQTAMDHSLAAAQGLLVAAQSGDSAAYGASLKAMGATCGSCHGTFKGK